MSVGGPSGTTTESSLSVHTHRWINTALAVIAGATAILTAVHEHQVVKLDVVPCTTPADPGNVPTVWPGAPATLNP